MSETPAQVKGPASKRTIIDAIVLAFSKSDVREVVGTDALKMVLEGRFMDMVRTPGVLDLQPVYDLLLSQPGVVPEQATPAFCRIKQWENRLNMPIEVPRELETLTSIERDRLAQKCKVADEELARVLNPGGAPATRPKEAPIPAAPQIFRATSTATAPSATRRIVAIVLFAAGVIGTGVSLWWALSGGKLEQVAPAQISTEIPLKAAQRSGETIGAVLADKGAWMARPEAERRRQLVRAFEKSQALGAAKLVLMDDQGQVFGHAQVGDDGKPTAALQ